jgi:hypothetical protein
MNQLNTRVHFASILFWGLQDLTCRKTALCSIFRMKGSISTDKKQPSALKKLNTYVQL